MLTHIGYDWGYRLIEQVIGQTSGVSQGVTAAYSLVYMIMPASFALYFGYLKAYCAGGRLWNFTLHGLLISFAVFVLCSGDIRGLALHPTEGIWALSGILVSSLLFHFGQKVFHTLENRLLKPAVALFAPVFAFLPTALAATAGLDYRIELVFFVCSLATGAFASAYLARARRLSSALSMGLVATLPVTLSNFFNVGGNLLSIVLDGLSAGAGLGFRAFLSASLIITAAFAAIISGASLACYLRQKQV